MKQIILLLLTLFSLAIFSCNDKKVVSPVTPTEEEQDRNNGHGNELDHDDDDNPGKKPN